MGEVHLFPKPNPFIFSTASLLKDQTEYILLYDQNRRMIHWLFQVIRHQLMSWYNPVDTILYSSTMVTCRQQTSYPWAHCNSAGLFATVFVVAHFYSWIVSNGASFPDCSLFTNSYFFWKSRWLLTTFSSLISARAQFYLHEPSAQFSTQCWALFCLWMFVLAVFSAWNVLN